MPLRLVRCALVIVLAMTLSWLSSAPASAHSDLSSSTPAGGATLEAAPPVVTLTFADAVIGEFTHTRVTKDGAPLEVPTPTSRDNVVTVQLPSSAGAGQYTVAYQIVSADSHPVSGELSFTVTAAASPTATQIPAQPPTPTRSLTPSTTPLAVSAQADGNPDASTNSWGGVAAMAAFVALATVGAALYLRSRRRS